MYSQAIQKVDEFVSSSEKSSDLEKLMFLI